MKAFMTSTTLLALREHDGGLNAIAEISIVLGDECFEMIDGKMTPRDVFSSVEFGVSRKYLGVLLLQLGKLRDDMEALESRHAPKAGAST